MGATTSGYRGTESDPWIDLQDGQLSNYDATEPGNVVQGARTALNGKTGSQTMTLAIGFGANPAAARATAAQSLAAGFSAAETAYNAGWLAYRASLKNAPASVAVGPAAAAPLRPVAARAGRFRGQDLPRRVDRVAEHAMDLGHADARARAPLLRPVPPRLAARPLPRGHGAEGGGRRRRRPTGCSTTSGGSRRRTARGGRTRSSTARRSGRPSSSTRRRSRSCSHGGWAVRGHRIGTTSSGRPTTWSRTGPRSDQERWENQDGYSPNTIATEIAGLICAADIARKNGEPGKAAEYEALADYWQQSVESWTATTNGPYSPKPYYVRVTKDGDPDDGSTYNLGDNFNRPVDEREIVDNSFLGLVLFGVKKWNDQTILNSLDVGDGNATTPYPLKVDTPSGPVWHRFTYDGYGEQARRRRLGPLLRQPGAPDPRSPVAAAHGRARRVRADRRRAARTCTWARSPTPRTTA